MQLCDLCLTVYMTAFPQHGSWTYAVHNTVTICQDSKRCGAALILAEPRRCLLHSFFRFRMGCMQLCDDGDWSRRLLAGRIAVDEFLRVLVTKNIEEGESGENHPEHGPSSVKEVCHGTVSTLSWLHLRSRSMVLTPTTALIGTLPAQVQPGGQEVVEGDADTLKHVPDVYALGDCCSPVDTPLPALAQVTP